MLFHYQKEKKCSKWFYMNCPQKYLGLRILWLLMSVELIFFLFAWHQPSWLAITAHFPASEFSRLDIPTMSERMKNGLNIQSVSPQIAINFNLDILCAFVAQLSFYINYINNKHRIGVRIERFYCIGIVQILSATISSKKV